LTNQQIGARIIFMKKLDKFINYAHRGASEYAPENTFLSFYYGLTMKANGIETDVQLTKDNVLVLFHDATLERVTDGKGNLCDYTFEELQSFWVKKGDLKDKIITLEDFLTHFSKMDLTFAIELKGDNTALPTAKILEKFNIPEKVVITSFKRKELLDFKKALPNYKTGFLAQSIEDELLAQLKNDGIDEFCPDAQFVTKENVEKWRSLGFNVRAWGVVNQDLMKNAYFSGVNGMTVNFPDKLTELIEMTE